MTVRVRGTGHLQEARSAEFQKRRANFGDSQPLDAKVLEELRRSTPAPSILHLDSLPAATSPHKTPEIAKNLCDWMRCAVIVRCVAVHVVTNAPTLGCLARQVCGTMRDTRTTQAFTSVSSHVTLLYLIYRELVGCDSAAPQMQRANEEPERRSRSARSRRRRVAEPNAERDVAVCVTATRVRSSIPMMTNTASQSLAQLAPAIDIRHI